MERPLEERTIRALQQIEDFAGAGAKLVRRGHEAYHRDVMLVFAGEAIARRIDDAVLRLDEAFLAAHPSIDWGALAITRDLGDGPAWSYDDYWEFLETRLPVEVRKVRRILDDWWSRPLPARADDDHLLDVAPPPRFDHGPGPGPIKDEGFRRVVERLDEWAESATASGDDGPIDVLWPSGRMVRIVMSAADLSNMLVVAGSVEGAVIGIMAALRELPQGTPYLVYGDTYSLVPSTQPILAPPPVLRLPEGGAWVAR